MNRFLTTSLIALMALVIFATSCQKETELKELVPHLPSTPYEYNTLAFKKVQNNGDNQTQLFDSNHLHSNPLTNSGATLGRLLFYDPRLSINNSVSCGSCHKQQFAFADNVAQSVGYQGQKTIRNTPAIINAMNKSSFFWDGRTTSLEEQTLLPVKNHIEMGLEKTDVLVLKLSQVSYYGQYFKDAFGSAEVTTDRISKALAQFVRSIASSTAPFDQFSTSADLDAGRTLFSQLRCSSCHRGNNLGGASLFSTYFSEQPQGTMTQVPNTSNIGLDISYADAGEQALTGKPHQNGYFIIPSLRNVAMTAPYMHDGRFKTLDEVIDHYSNGIQSHPDLDPLLLQQNFNQGFVTVSSGEPVRMNITADQKRQLKVFLSSLTDETIITDPKFSDPFK